VHGFLLKDAAATDMVSAVRAAAAGGAPISPRAAESLFERVRADAARLHPASDGGPGLTRRELEVLRLLTAGKSNAQIARELYISSLTVKHHISSIIRKLGVANRIQVAVRAVRDRIV
jgi:DNA-binding NarL/FixJ family response regulator